MMLPDSITVDALHGDQSYIHIGIHENIREKLKVSLSVIMGVTFSPLGGPKWSYSNAGQ